MVAAISIAVKPFCPRGGFCCVENKPPYAFSGVIGMGVHRPDPDTFAGLIEQARIAAS